MADVSISTMWSLKYAEMSDFLQDAREFGFNHLELNSALEPDGLNELLDRDGLKISSVHAPCPNRDTPEGLASTLSLSSFDEDQRRMAVEGVKWTIDTAVETGARVVVIHAGFAEIDPEMERNLRHLWKREGAKGPESAALICTMMEIRQFFACPHVDAAKESLLEIAAYARPKGIQLAIENRAHFHEIPNFDEMMDILGEFQADVMGYWHDVGHAEMQSRLGFTPHEDWLVALNDRLVSIHLHDLRDLQDHYAPGSGDMDWDTVAQNLPRDAIRVCEIAQWNEIDHARETVAFLREKGIV